MLSTQYRLRLEKVCKLIAQGKEVDLMQDINTRRNTPSRPTYESLGTSEYEED